MRIIIRSNKFDEFYNSLPEKAQNKLDYALNILRERDEGCEYQVGKEVGR